MEENKKFRLTVEGDFHDDGDFRFEEFEDFMEDFGFKLNRVDDLPNYHGYKGAKMVDFSYDEDYEYFGFCLCVEGEKQSCKNVVKDFLEKLVIRFRTNPNHYYLIGYIYELIEGALTELRESSVIRYNSSISGNYEGTQLTVRGNYMEEEKTEKTEEKVQCLTTKSINTFLV